MWLVTWFQSHLCWCIGTNVSRFLLGGKTDCNLQIDIRTCIVLRNCFFQTAGKNAIIPELETIAKIVFSICVQGYLSIKKYNRNKRTILKSNFIFANEMNKPFKTWWIKSVIICTLNA